MSGCEKVALKHQCFFFSDLHFEDYSLCNYLALARIYSSYKMLSGTVGSAGGSGRSPSKGGKKVSMPPNQQGDKLGGPTMIELEVYSVSVCWWLVLVFLYFVVVFLFVSKQWIRFVSILY